MAVDTSSWERQSHTKAEDPARIPVAAPPPPVRAAPTLGRCAAVELAGSYLLVLAGTGVAVGATLAPASYDALAVALAFGLTLAALAVALGPLSGCHLNPAVTLGLTVARRFPVRSVPAYLLAQLGGAVLASLTVWAGWGARARQVAHLGVPQPGAGLGVARTALVEAAITFVLVLVVMAAATDQRVPPAAGGLVVGFALFAAVAVGGPLTGGAVNPARALGPMLVAGRFPMWGVYLLAPIAGGLLAAAGYTRVLAPTRPPRTWMAGGR